MRLEGSNFFVAYRQASASRRVDVAIGIGSFFRFRESSTEASRRRTTEAQRAQRQHRGDKDRSECLGRPMHIKKVWDVQETHDSSKTTHLLLSSVRPLCPLCLCGSLVRIARPTNGEEGIRTLETLTGLPVFKTGAFNHSATSPRLDHHPTPRSPVSGSGWAWWVWSAGTSQMRSPSNQKSPSCCQWWARRTAARSLSGIA